MDLLLQPHLLGHILCGRRADRLHFKLELTCGNDVGVGTGSLPRTGLLDECSCER
jgi:hypothetical protein